MNTKNAIGPGNCPNPSNTFTRDPGFPFGEEACANKRGPTICEAAKNNTATMHEIGACVGHLAELICGPRPCENTAVCKAPESLKEEIEHQGSLLDEIYNKLRRVLSELDG